MYFFQSITALIPGFFDDLVFGSYDSSIDEETDETARSRKLLNFNLFKRGVAVKLRASSRDVVCLLPYFHPKAPLSFAVFSSKSLFALFSSQNLITKIRLFIK